MWPFVCLVNKCSLSRAKLALLQSGVSEPTQLRADECFEYKNTDVFFLSALALQTLKQNVRSISCVNNTNIKMAVISIARYLTDKSEHTALFKITLNLQYTFTHII